MPSRMPCRVKGGGQLANLAAQGGNFVLQCQDPLDAGQADALLLGEPLHLAQQRDIARRLASPAALGAGRGYQPEPVVLA